MVAAVVYTGGVIRMCDCGTDNWPVSACLKVFRQGRRECARCEVCQKIWDVDSFEVLEGQFDAAN